MPYRTSSAPYPSTSPTCTITITVPDERIVLTTIFGALLDLTYPSSYEQIDPNHRTPEEQADVLNDVLNSLVKNC